MEIEKLTDIFVKNGYPYKFIEKIVNHFLKQQNRNQNDDSSTTSENAFTYLRIPYVGKPSLEFSKKIANLIHDKFDIEIKVAYYTLKVRNYFGLKSKIPLLFRSNVVYKYVCSCEKNTSYIGMTSRQLFVRINEHFDKSKNSAINSHLIQCRACHDLKPTSKNFQIIKKCRYVRDTEINEAILIKKHKPNLNVQLGAYQGSSFLLRVFK